MKKKLTKTLAVLLMLCMLLPQTALAATTYYIEVSISGPDAEGIPQTVNASSSHYGTLDDKLAATVVSLINSVKYELEDKFSGTGLRTDLEEGLDAFDSDSAWETYVNDHFESVGGNSGFKSTLSDKSSTFGDITVNQANRLTYSGYTVIVTLREYKTGGGSGSQTTKPDKPTQPVTSKPTEKGKVSVSTNKASENEKVTVNVTPDEGYVVNRVIVTDSQGNQIVITATGDNNTYTFEMPDDAVDVQVTFIREPVSPSETKVDTMLNIDADLAYLQGKEDNLFNPEQPITRGQVATIFYRLLKDTNVEITKTFTDVPEGFWCEDAVNTLAALGIVNGVSDEKFDPNRPITRAQFVAICARFAQAITEGENFKDVSEDYWAYEYITTASGYGWINGVGNDMFAPDKPITRAQAATIVNRMLARIADRAAIDAGVQRYDDVPRTYWAWYDICEASTGVVPR